MAAATISEVGRAYQILSISPGLPTCLLLCDCLEQARIKERVELVHTQKNCLPMSVFTHTKNSKLKHFQKRQVCKFFLLRGGVMLFKLLLLSRVHLITFQNVNIMFLMKAAAGHLRTRVLSSDQNLAAQAAVTP